MYLCRFLDELNAKIQKDHRENSTLPKITKPPRQDKDDGNDKNQKGKSKKQLGDMDEKVNKGKEKKDRKEEEKMEKKGKQPSKLSKTIQNKSESLVSTKESNTLGTNLIEFTTRALVGIKSKPGKATGAELIQEPDICKSAKTFSSDSSEGTKTGTGLRDDNTVAAKPKQGKCVSPEPRQDYLKNTKNTKDTDCTHLRSSYPDTAVPSETEKNMMGMWRSSKSEPSQGFWKSRSNLNTNVLKFSQSSTTDYPNVSSHASLDSAVNQTGTSLALQEHQLSSNDSNEVTNITIPSVTKPCKIISTLEHQSFFTVPKSLKVSDNEDKEDLTFSVSIGASTTSLVIQTSKVSGSSSKEQKNNHSETESGGSHSKSLIGEPQENLESFSNHTKPTATVALKTLKTAFYIEARKKSDNPGKNDTTNIPGTVDLTSIPSTATPDHRALTRGFVLHNMDSAALNEFVHHSYPPPPPSSTPVLLPPPSTPLLPPSSVISTNSPPISNHLTLGMGFHPVNHNLRY